MSAKEDIEVTIVPPGADSAKHQAVITDRAAKRAWSGEGDSSNEAATEATRKFLGDRRTREYMEK